jgi:PAS domain S-box-containing protein
VKIPPNAAFFELLMLLLALSMTAFIIGILLMRRMRRNIGRPTVRSTTRTDSPAFATAAYQAVIQQLKEKEQELKRLRQAASERAAASENVSAAVLENLPSGVVLFNTSGLVQQANPAAREILGYASITGLHARDVFGSATTADADGLASIAEVVDCCLKQGRIFRRLEADYITPAGGKRVLGVTASPFTHGGGERRGAACLVTDLTEVASLAGQLRLKESLAALGEMSAGIAHEFKNSLATISGYSQMLASENDAESIRQFAAKIRSETAQLTRTVTDFLNFARPQAVTPEPVRIAPLLAACAEDAGIELEAGEVPPDFDVVADPLALRQCLQNLLRNSAEACPERKVRVRARAAVDGISARIELRDDAGGIAPEVLPRIFIPFVTTKSQGNGLGLALAQRIVSEHGGTISASNEGPGALFILSLPLQKVAKPAAIRG